MVESFIFGFDLSDICVSVGWRIYDSVCSFLVGLDCIFLSGFWFEISATTMQNKKRIMPPIYTFLYMGAFMYVQLNLPSSTGPHDLGSVLHANVNRHPRIQVGWH